MVTTPRGFSWLFVIFIKQLLGAWARSHFDKHLGTSSPKGIDVSGLGVPQGCSIPQGFTWAHRWPKSDAPRINYEYAGS